MMAISISAPTLYASSLRGKRSVEAISLCYLLVALLYSNVFAQQPRQLSIGDTLPNLVVNNLIHPQTSPTTTKELYTGGALIINFWATWCGPCIKEMKMLAAQVKLHKGRFKVLCLTYEDQRTIQLFLKNNPEIANSDLIIASNDIDFGKMFFHQALPHNIWINHKGVVKAITGGEEVNADNISRFLIDSNHKMAIKKELPFNQFKPMHVPDSLIEYRSIFNRRLEGVALSGTTIDGSRHGYANMKRFFIFNMQARYLLWYAHQMPGLPNPASLAYLTETITTDSLKYFWPGENADPKNYKGLSRPAWSRDHIYSYELRTPEVLADSDFFAKVISELEFNLKLKTSRENRLKRCVVVSLDPDYSFKQPQAGGKVFCGIKGSRLTVANAPLDYILYWLSRSTYTRDPLAKRIEPYLNQAGENKKLSFSVDLGENMSLYRSQAHLEKCLTEQAGFKFEFKETMFPILIIRDI